MGRDKLWIEIYGRPVWRWSLDALLAVPEVTTIAVVTPAGSGDDFRQLLPGGTDGHGRRFEVTDGGATRADSVIAGLDALTRAGVADDALVLVHDAARPAASADLVHRVIAAADDALVGGGGVVPAVPVHDSLRRVMSEEGRSVVVETVDRTALVATQTPQLGTLGALRDALRASGALGMEVTDEAAALAAARHVVRVVAGDPANHKLTDLADEELVRAVIHSRSMPVAPPPAVEPGWRVGVGFDAHRLVEGRTLRLGGVAFPEEPAGLVGHSDGDVALHAVIDALLGAAGAGDIGTAFPDDERWRDADSAELLRLAAEQVRERGWSPVSADLVIVATRPVIAPRRVEIEERIASVLGVPASAVSARGTTSDGLGFTAAEGVAAHAIAVVRPAERE